MNLTMIGIDLAKAVFQLHGVDDKGRVVMKKQVKRAQMLPFFVLVEGGAPGCCGEPAGRIGSTFTVNRMKLPPSLTRCLCTTNIIENPNRAVRRVSRRVCRYRDADMALRWTATRFLEVEKPFRRRQGAKNLWILASALGLNVTGIDSKNRVA